MNNKIKFIPYGRQWIDEDDINEVVSVLRTDWLTQGPKIEEFEKAVADYCGAKYGVAVSSGTAALHGAYWASGIGPGDEIITTPLTFAATANVAVHLGAKPVFADIEKDSLNVNPAEIEKKITPRTKTIVTVDFGGHPCDYEKILEIAKKNNLLVIEDGCHALGAEYLPSRQNFGEISGSEGRGKKVGSLADMTVFTFHPVKAITSGEGGMVLTDNKDFFEKLKLFRNHGMNKRPEKGGWYYEIEKPAFNYRLTDIQCALGLSQLKKLDKFISRRREIVEKYNKGFKEVKEIIIPAEKDYAKSSWHIYPIQLDLDRLNASRKEIFEEFQNNNIGVQVHYIPLHFQPFYNKMGYNKGDFPNAERYYERAVTLPLFPKMTDEEVEYVIETTNKIINKYKKNMSEKTFQEEKWVGQFGNDYRLRNPLTTEEMDALYIKNSGIKRTELDKEFLDNFDRSIKILEVGSNVGIQLTILQKMGFKNLYGIEINRETVEFSKSITKNINIIQGSAFDMPFKDNYFDLVFTSGVLIHIAPSDLEKAIKEIYRCSKKYIWGFEPYHENLVEIPYRGNENLHWKGNYAKIYLDNFKDLEIVKEKKISYLSNENIDAMFLFEKKSKVHKKIGIIVQARTGSTRLPYKIFADIEGKPMLWRVIERLKLVKRASQIILAIPETKENNVLEEFALENNLNFFRGSEDDVLSRYYSAAKKFGCDIIVRIPADNPLIDPKVIDLIIKRHLDFKNDCTSNVIERTFPRGLDTEVINFEVLEKAHNEAKENHNREHVTPYIYSHPELFKLENVEAEEILKRPDIRLAVDEKEDLDLIREIYKRLYSPNFIFYTEEIISLLDKEPALKEINHNVKQQSSWYKDPGAEKLLELIKKEEPEKADAIVWLQGDMYDRGIRSLELFQEGYADKIVVSGNDSLNKPGENLVTAEEMAQWLKEKGLKPEEIIIDNQSFNTRYQAVNVLALAERNNWKRIILVASLYHQPRAFLTFLKRAEEINWQGKLINQPAEFNWDSIPAGRNRRGKELFVEEVEKILKYEDAAGFEKGVSYIVNRE